jgi:uncharacterized protein (DUF362 family)
VSPEPANSSISRRAFLWRSAKTGLALGVSAAVSAWLYDPDGPGSPRDGAAKLLQLPDFSIAGAAPRMSLVTGSDRTQTVQLALQSLGGIESFIKRGDRVLIKVNAAFAMPPALCATTHPDLVSEVVRLCLQAGAASVVVTDNPINDPQSCFALTGIGPAAEQAGARLVLPREGLFRPLTLAGGVHIRDWPVLFEPFAGVTKLIGIAPVKDHHRSGASMTMKNWYGLLGGRRNIFHQDVHTLIQELARMVKPTLVILDGTMTMMTNGPTGGSMSDLKPTSTLIASTDQVAADAFGATLLGRPLSDLPFIGKAEAAGCGTADFESLKPIRTGTPV